MYEYIKGMGSVWVSPDTPPAYAKNCLWLRQDKDPKKRYQLLYYNANNALGRWENVTPGYVLFYDVRGIAEPGPNFHPIVTNDYISYIGSGAGVYENFIQSNGKPITITSNTSVVILYKDKDSAYWTYKEVECQGPQGLSAYDLAKLGGYTGSKEQFYLDLAQVSNKVDKIPGKGLSTNDFTNSDRMLVGTISSKVNRDELQTVAFDGKHHSLQDTYEPDCHPIEAITGLRKELDGKQPKGDYAHLDKNGKVIETANNSDRLNGKVESELHVDTADKAIGDEDGVNIKLNYARKTEIGNHLDGVTYDAQRGIWTFTKADGTTTIIDQPIEQIVKNGYYDPQTKEIVLVMWDDSEVRIPAEELVTAYQGAETESASVQISADNIISVLVKDYVSKTYIDNQLVSKEDKANLKALAYKDTVDYDLEVSNKPTLNGHVIQKTNTTDSLGLEHNVVYIGTETPSPDWKELWVDTSDISPDSGMPLYEGVQYEELVTTNKTVLGAINEIVAREVGRANAVPIINVDADTYTLTSNIFYNWTTNPANLNLVLETPIANTLAKYMFQFTTGETIPTITFTPNTIKWVDDTPALLPSSIYQVEIINNIASLKQIKGLVTYSNLKCLDGAYFDFGNIVDTTLKVELKLTIPTTLPIPDQQSFYGLMAIPESMEGDFGMYMEGINVGQTPQTLAVAFSGSVGGNSYQSQTTLDLTNSTINRDTPVTMTFKRGEVTYNGIVGDTLSESGTVPTSFPNLRMGFATLAGQTIPMDYTMHELKIYKGDTLIRHCVPAKKDNQGCLYDYVSADYIMPVLGETGSISIS